MKAFLGVLFGIQLTILAGVSAAKDSPFKGRYVLKQELKKYNSMLIPTVKGAQGNTGPSASEEPFVEGLIIEKADRHQLQLFLLHSTGDALHRHYKKSLGIGSYVQIVANSKKIEFTDQELVASPFVIGFIAKKYSKMTIVPTADGIKVDVRFKSPRGLFYRGDDEHKTYNFTKVPMDWEPDVEERDGRGQTRLHHAAEWGIPKRIRELIRMGADVNAVDVAGNTPLHIAGSVARPEDVTKPLVEAGASLEAQNKEGKTPIQLACLVFKEQTSPFGAWWISGRYVRKTPEGVLNSVKGFVALGSDLEVRDRDGLSLLHLAALTEYNAGLVALLSLSGVELNPIDYQGNTPLHLAIIKSQGRYNIKDIPVFLANGANAQAKDAKGNSALHLASRFGNLEMVEMLLAHGADKTALDSKGKTPFEVAAVDMWRKSDKVLQELQDLLK